MSTNHKPRFHLVHKIVLDIEPIPWARTQLAPIQDGSGTLIGVRPITPKKQRQGRKDFLKVLLRKRPKKPIQGAVGLEITAFLRIPKSWPKYKKREALSTIIRPESAPDWDNYGKFISDALNKIAYPDDRHVVGAGVSLFYSDRPRWEIKLYRWGI